MDKAVLLAAGRPEELVFRRALEVVSVDGEATLLDVPPSASEYARTGGEQQWQVRA